MIYYLTITKIYYDQLCKYPPHFYRVVYSILILSSVFFFFSCEKDELIPAGLENSSVVIDRNAQSHPLTNDWSLNSYLKFNDADEVTNVYKTLKVKFGESNYDALNLFEETRGFYSMRRAYDDYEETSLENGLSPGQIIDIPIINDVLSSMISVDGLIQVGSEIQYFSSDVYAKAPIAKINRLRDIIVHGDVIRPSDELDGVILTPRNSSFCEASFNVSINHSTFEVDVVYTGETPNGEDKLLTWSVGSNNDNQINFSHQFSDPGEKQICATFSEREIFQDTVCFFLPATRDSTFTLPSGQDTTITISFFRETCLAFDNVRIGCTSTICKDIVIGGCTADFTSNIGIDNVVNFVNQSSSANGTITGYQWNFGDGNTSTLVNPTHTYECDRDYNVNLIVFSAQCPQGQAVVSQTISASGVNCCDSNPSSRSKIQVHPTDDKKRIRYRYDMGSTFEWLNDQDFKAKIEYFEKRRGNLGGKTRWRKTSGLLDVNFDGNVFAEDEEGCKCQDPRSLSASPSNKEARGHTFKDPLANTAFSTNVLWLKQSSPVYIDWMVDGVLYLRQNAQLDPAFQCD